MPTVISHKEWMKLTNGGRTSVRSRSLKRVDRALESYHRNPSTSGLNSLQGALLSWMKEKGNGWKTSVRNRHNAVDTLYRQVAGIGGPGAVDAAGKQALEAQPREVVHNLFGGKQIKWKNEFSGKLNSNLVKPRNSDFAPRVAARQYKTSAATNKIGTALNTGGLVTNSVAADGLRRGSGQGKTGRMLSGLVSSIVPESAQTEVLGAVRVLIPSFDAEFAAAVMPLAGVITAAGATIWNTGTAAKKHHGVQKTRMHRDRSLAGVEAEQAINALIRILERERNADIYSASVSVLELGGKLAGLAIDGGVASNTAVSLAANVAKLGNIIRIVYRDIREKKAANRLMLDGRVDISVFEECPLVGCYLVCCAPTSVLMSLIIDRFGHAGWMDAAERTAVRHIDPLRAKARDVIAAHRFEIPSLTRFPGVLKPNEEELERMKASVGKSGFDGFDANSIPDRAAV